MKKPIDDLTPELLLELNAFMSEKAVMRATSLSRTSLHRKRLAGVFPEPEPISWPRRVTESFVGRLQIIDGHAVQDRQIRSVSQSKLAYHLRSLGIRHQILWRIVPPKFLDQGSPLTPD